RAPPHAGSIQLDPAAPEKSSASGPHLPFGPPHRPTDPLSRRLDPPPCQPDMGCVASKPAAPEASQKPSYIDHNPMSSMPQSPGMQHQQPRNQMDRDYQFHLEQQRRRQHQQSPTYGQSPNPSNSQLQNLDYSQPQNPGYHQLQNPGHNYPQSQPYGRTQNLAHEHSAQLGQLPPSNSSLQSYAGHIPPGAHPHQKAMPYVSGGHTSDPAFANPSGPQANRQYPPQPMHSLSSPSILNSQPNPTPAASVLSQQPPQFEPHPAHISTAPVHGDAHAHVISPIAGSGPTSSPSPSWLQHHHVQAQRANSASPVQQAAFTRHSNQSHLSDSKTFLNSVTPGHSPSPRLQADLSRKISATSSNAYSTGTPQFSSATPSPKLPNAEGGTYHPAPVNGYAAPAPSSTDASHLRSAQDVAASPRTRPDRRVGRHTRAKEEGASTGTPRQTHARVSHMAAPAGRGAPSPAMRNRQSPSSSTPVEVVSVRAQQPHKPVFVEPQLSYESVWEPPADATYASLARSEFDPFEFYGTMSSNKRQSIQSFRISQYGTIERPAPEVVPPETSDAADGAPNPGPPPKRYSGHRLSLLSKSQKPNAPRTMSALNPMRSTVIIAHEVIVEEEEIYDPSLPRPLKGAPPSRPQTTAITYSHDNSDDDDDDFEEVVVIEDDDEESEVVVAYAERLERHLQASQTQQTKTPLWTGQSRSHSLEGQQSPRSARSKSDRGSAKDSIASPLPSPATALRELQREARPPAPRPAISEPPVLAVQPLPEAEATPALKSPVDEFAARRREELSPSPDDAVKHYGSSDTLLGPSDSEHESHRHDSQYPEHDDTDDQHDEPRSIQRQYGDDGQDDYRYDDHDDRYNSDSRGNHYDDEQGDYYGDVQGGYYGEDDQAYYDDEYDDAYDYPDADGVAPGGGAVRRPADDAGARVPERYAEDMDFEHDDRHTHELDDGFDPAGAAVPNMAELPLSHPDHYFEDEPENPFCGFCEEAIEERPMYLLGRWWHPHHAKCKECSRTIGVDNFAEIDNFLYCEDHYYEIHGVYQVRKGGPKKKRASFIERDLAEITKYNTVKKVRNLFNYQRSMRLNIITVEEGGVSAGGVSQPAQQRRFVTSFLGPPSGLEHLDL
ncbi:uncharacterized protein BJ171DRAFT_126486, partial [Polychytrium aggregatum]|uniref:uncharacterized protein n=1 Tax=Polychytrium aggregatum TaxID=110093 RepID=UPI0022FE3FC5